MEKNPPVCETFHRAIELIGRRWNGAIVFVLLRSRSRYSALREAIPGITDRMLSERLQELEHEGIIERAVVPETPVRVEYALTKKGRALAAALNAVGAWAHKWMTDAVTPPTPSLSSPRRTAAAASRSGTRSR